SQVNPYAIPIFEQILRPFRDLGVVAFRDEYSCCGDNQSFDSVGVPGFELIQDPIDDDTYHTNIDTYDALLLDDLKQAAVVVGSTVYLLMYKKIKNTFQQEHVGRSPRPMPSRKTLLCNELPF